MKKRLLAIALAIAICLSLIFGTAFAPANASDAATKLNTLGLFRGVGTNADGSPDFALDRAPTRAEAVVMLVRLIGKEAEALSGSWDTPFTDVPGWAEPFVGYAYTHQLAFGVDAVTFGSDRNVTSAEFISFVLRALGYMSGVDFEWDKAWVLSDALGITNGEYKTATTAFLRRDIAEISFNALNVKQKGSNKTLYASLIESGAFTENSAKAAGLGAAAAAPSPALAPANTSVSGASDFEKAVFDLINKEREQYGLGPLKWDQELADIARANCIDMVQRGFFSHTNPEGKTPGDRMHADGINYTYCAENIAHGQRTPEAVVEGWMNSAGHRKTILGEKAIYMGVGYYNNYWTTDFAAF